MKQLTFLIVLIANVITPSRLVCQTVRIEHAEWENGKPPTEEELRNLWLGGGKLLRQRWDEPGVLQLRPDYINESAWEGILMNLRSAVGNSVGDWARVMSDNAQYLARHAQPNANINDLWGFEVLQADGLGPVPVLDAVTDASMVTPGLALAVSRSFPNSISGRHVFGPFGYGWTFNWNLRLVEATNGLVQIGSCCGGSQRRYEPDMRNPGKYFSMPGDTSKLAKLSNGTFELRSPGGTVTRFAYNGILLAVVDPNSNTVMPSFDPMGRLQKLTHSSGAFITISYNAAGRIGSLSDLAGRTNTFAYDAAGLYLQAVTTSDGKTTTYSYQTSGDARVLHALTSIQRGGTTRHFAYDERGRLASTHLAGGEQLVQFTYDSAGTVSVTDSLGTTKLYFNQVGLLTKVSNPNGGINSRQFDSDFRLKRFVSSTGEERSFAWLDSGNCLRLTDEMGRSSTLTFEPSSDKLLAFSDAKGNTTKFTYGANLMATIYPDGSLDRLVYDSEFGHLVAFTNRQGLNLNYQHNNSTGQIIKQIYADGRTVHFSYDTRGNLLAIVEGLKTTTYAYDHAGDGDRLRRVTYPNGKSLNYTYDRFGRRIQIADQDGFATRFEYDSAGRLWKLRDEADTLLITYSYGPSGRLSRTDKGNGTFTTYEYDPAGQLLSLKNHRNANMLNSRFDYTYDRRGRRISMSTLDGNWTYSYDALGQLTRAVFVSVNTNIPNQDLIYEYDALGNRNRTIENGVTNLYVANNLNQYTSAAGTNYNYDANGNLLCDGVNTYEWDQENRLVRVVRTNGATEYQYDVLGNLVATTRNTERREYLVDQTGFVNLMSEYDKNGFLIGRYVVGIGIEALTSAAGERVYFDFDGLGSICSLTDSNGTIRSSYVYTPFGQILLAVAGIDNRLRFVGRFGVSHEGEDLYLMRARFFRASTGSFMSVDPIGLRSGDLNFYAYVKNRPTFWIDPLGLAKGEFSYGHCCGEESNDCSTDPSRTPLTGDGGVDFACFVHDKCLAEAGPWFSPNKPRVQQCHIDLCARLKASTPPKGSEAEQVKDLLEKVFCYAMPLLRQPSAKY